MRKPFLWATLLLVTPVFFVACSPSAPAETQLLPGNAQLVVSLDPGYAAQKLTAEGMPLDSLMNKILLRDSLNPQQKSILAKIRAGGGLQWKGKWHWALSQQMQDSLPITQYNVVGGITDALLFEQLVQTDSLLGKNIQQGKGFKYVFTDRYSILAWTDKYLLTTAWNYPVKPYYDTVQGRFIIPEKKDFRPQILAQTAQLLDQKKSASMASQKGFAAMFKTPAEGYVYTNSSQYSALLGQLPLPLPKIEELLADNYTTATLQFEKGKILATVTTHTNPLLSKVFRQHAGPVVDLRTIAAPAGYQLKGFYAAKFDPAIFTTLLKELEVDQLAQAYLKEKGLPDQVLSQAFKGGFQVVLADSTGSNKTKVLLAIPLTDTAKANALLGPLAQKGFLVRGSNGQWQSGDLLKSFSLMVNMGKDWMVVSNDANWNNQFLLGQCQQSLSQPIQTAFANKSTAGWLNLDRGKSTDSLPKDPRKKILESLFKDLRLYSENFKDGTITGKGEINLFDQETTSLAKMLSLLTDLALNKHQDWQTAALEEKSIPLAVPGVIRAN